MLQHRSLSVNTGEAGPFWASAPSFIPYIPILHALLFSPSLSLFQDSCGNTIVSCPDFQKHNHYFLEKMQKAGGPSCRLWVDYAVRYSELSKPDLSDSHDG